MSLSNSLYERIADFLEEHAPFQYIGNGDLLAIAKTVKIKFHEEGEFLYQEGKPRKKFFYVVNKGTVEVTSSSESLRSFVDTRTVGDLIGTGHLIDSEGSYVNTAEIKEDTILYAIPWEPFSQLLPKYPDVVRFLKANISLRSDISLPEYLENLAQNKGLPDTLVGRIEETAQLSDYSKSRLITCKPEISLQEMAYKMMDQKAEVVVIINDQEHPIGIVTKTDMTRALQLGQSSRSITASSIMSFPVITVKNNPTLGTCLSMMMKSGFQHICMTEDGSPNSATLGVISERDLMLYYGNNPMVIIRQIDEINSFEELSHMRHRADMLLLHELRRPEELNWFADVVHDLNRAFVRKVIRLSMNTLRLEGIYLPQSSFCLFFAGMGGRKELFTRYAMDRGLVYLPDFESNSANCDEYFPKLAVRIHEGLLKCGWTKNLREYTEKNPEWCQPIGKWKSYFNGWISGKGESDWYKNLNWFDMLAGDGFETLIDEINVSTSLRVSSNPEFLERIAGRVISVESKADSFSEFAKSREKDPTSLFDLHSNIIEPMVQIARLLAFESGFTHSASTYDRFTKLAEISDENRSLFEEAAEGFRFALFIHARVGLRDQNSGNFIRSQDVDSFEYQMLKSTFRVLIALRDMVEKKFLAK